MDVPQKLVDIYDVHRRGVSVSKLQGFPLDSGWAACDCDDLQHSFRY